MNEQIEKIYGEACIHYVYLDEREFCEKFAELIVRECASIAQLQDSDGVVDVVDYNSGRTWAGIDILKHFRVE